MKSRFALLKQIFVIPGFAKNCGLVDFKNWRREWDSNLTRFRASEPAAEIPSVIEGPARLLAERVGFEPTLEFPLNTLSKRAPSATRPSLRRYQEAARRRRRRASGCLRFYGASVLAATSPSATRRSDSSAAYYFIRRGSSTDDCLGIQFRTKMVAP
jgi:hypothetical protein